MAGPGSLRDIGFQIAQEVPDLQRRLDLIVATQKIGLDKGVIWADETLWASYSPASGAAAAKSVADQLRKAGKDAASVDGRPPLSRQTLDLLENHQRDPYFAVAFAKEIPPKELKALLGDLYFSERRSLEDIWKKAPSSEVDRLAMALSVNYLWDETVIELRKRVIGYDLSYFYAVAEKSDSRRKELKTAEDLVKLDDAKLLSGAREIGLISDVGYHQVDHIRFMRNYASAAHPNQVTLTGLQLADWLETCIREVITLPHDTVVAEIQKLLINVKAKLMDSSPLAQTAAFFKRLPSDQADTLATGLFSVYTTVGAEPFTLDNIRALWPKLWAYVSEETRHAFGTRLGRFQANADHDQAILARQLIDLVQGAAYLPGEIVAAEMAETLEELMNVHLGWDNFYNEPRVARKLAELVGQQGAVPRAEAFSRAETE
ncbi:hypothetical protein [Nonomuraea candida]|uniref:hypothetical protein n=1 Tax=Nonomuraea candida TaxID=359159 RepID=UPI000694276F|nr:hypothetical protein [Nonomuraea candida]